jgi:hypothetical protein
MPSRNVQFTPELKCAQRRLVLSATVRCSALARMTECSSYLIFTRSTATRRLA